MRRANWLAVALGIAAVGVAGAVWGTTYHSITIDGNLSDFSSDEKSAGDPTNDSLYGVDNELSTLFASWDAQKLYLGFDYKIQGGAVMYLLSTGKANGVTNLCTSGGYIGSYKANVQGLPINLMVAFWADQDNPSSKPTLHVYSLESNSSTEITSTSGIELALVESLDGDKRTGSVEVAIPWDVMFGLGSGKVPANTTIRVAGVLRGKVDGDGLGDANPSPTTAVKNSACGGSDANYLDKYFELSIDDGSGTPRIGWSPGSNLAASDAGVRVDAILTPDRQAADRIAADTSTVVADRQPVSDRSVIADSKPGADTWWPIDRSPTADQQAVADAKPSPDSRPARDSKVTGDHAAADHKSVTADKSLVDQHAGADGVATADRKTGKGDTGNRGSSDNGCTCRTTSAGSDLRTGLLPLLLLALALGIRRRRLRRTR